MRRYDYDLLTIGAGSGGVAASRRAGAAGARVAICEEGRVGGTCVLRGCVPKKLLWYASHFRDEVIDARSYGWDVADDSLDWNQLIEAKDAELERLEGVYQRLLRQANVDVKEGRGVVVDEHTVEVAGHRVTAKRILIATGGRPSRIEVPGRELLITSDEALALRSVPKHVAIVGGGYIAVEFAGIWKGAGADVTLVVRGDNVLRGFDEDVRRALSEAMEGRGIGIRRSACVRSVEREKGHKLRLTLDDGETLQVDQVLCATGREPNSRELGLEQLGVELTDTGNICVDEWSRTSAAGIWAVGDVTNRQALTPVAIADGRAFVATEFGNNPTPVDHETVPSAVFSNPPVGTVGMNESEARSRRSDGIEVYRSNFRPMKFSLTRRVEKTMMKLIVDGRSDRVLGLHMVGPDAPEIVQGFAVALKAGATKRQFDATLGIHPTLAEEFVTMATPV